MPDEASTPAPLPPIDAVSEAPMGMAADSDDSLAHALDAVRRTDADDGDVSDIAADDAGATRLAEEMNAGLRKPA